MSITYKEAGVDIAAADEFVKKINRAMYSTQKNPVVDHGAYASVVTLDSGHKLAATCDGVGTKLLLAKQTGLYEGLGQDLVAMNVNDLVAIGAKPLFFLDYISTGKLQPQYMERIIKGAAKACRESGCMFIGGETAEMPGLYQEGHFDLAGFAVGMVEGDWKPTTVKPGDAIIGLTSSGLHSNGYSLVRKIIKEEKISLNNTFPPGGTKTIGEIFMEPTRVYVKQVLELIDNTEVRAMAHITGGGLEGRVEKMIPNGCIARINSFYLPRLDAFDILSSAGISNSKMNRVFNRGIGFVAIIDERDMFDAEQLKTKWIRIGTVREVEAPKVAIK